MANDLRHCLTLDTNYFVSLVTNMRNVDEIRKNYLSDGLDWSQIQMTGHKQPPANLCVVFRNSELGFARASAPLAVFHQTP